MGKYHNNLHIYFAILEFAKEISEWRIRFYVVDPNIICPRF